MREQTEWHRVVLFGKLAEVAGEYLREGVQVYIEGQLRTRSWEDNGITRYVTEILGPRPQAPCRCWDVPQVLDSAGRGATVQRSASAGTTGGGQYEKGGAKRKAVDVRPRSRSLSCNRRRVTITGFQTISRSERADCDNRPPCSVRGITGEMRMREYFQNTSGAAGRLLYPQQAEAVAAQYRNVFIEDDHGEHFRRLSAITVQWSGVPGILRTVPGYWMNHAIRDFGILK